MKLKVCGREMLRLPLSLVIPFILPLRKSVYPLEHVLFNYDLATEHSSVAKSILIHNMALMALCSLRAFRLSLLPCNTDRYPLRVYSAL